MTRNYRFDLLEATLSNSASDVADISAINQFGSALTLAVQYQGGLTDTRGYAVSGAAIDTAITQCRRPASRTRSSRRPATRRSTSCAMSSCPATTSRPTRSPAATGPPTSTPSRTGRTTSRSSRPSTDRRCSPGGAVGLQGAVRRGHELVLAGSRQQPRRDVDGLHQHLDAGPDQQRLPADRQVARLCRIEDGG